MRTFRFRIREQEQYLLGEYIFVDAENEDLAIKKCLRLLNEEKDRRLQAAIEEIRLFHEERQREQATMRLRLKRLVLLCEYELG